MPAATVVPTAQVASNQGQVPIDWRGMEAWKKSSGYAQSYVWHEGMRNPFAPMQGEPTAEVSIVEEHQEQIKQEVAQELQKQQQLAELATLQLTSTLIMPGQRSATINGKVYREGEPVTLGSPGETTSAESAFVTGNAPQQQPHAVAIVRRIESQNVMLEYGEQLYPLPLKRPTSSSILLELR